MSKTKFFIFVFFLLSFFACKAEVEKKDFYYLKNENLAKTQQLAKTQTINTEVFIAGTCSHHLLVSKQIDAWFASLKTNREDNKKPIKTFIIISPSHYGKSFQQFSLTNKNWMLSSDEYIFNDLKTSKKICSLLNVAFDNEAFAGEHGVNSLLPFIKAYFPDSKIVPILVPETQNDTFLASELINCLSEYFVNSKRNTLNTENFLLISTDFSHHQDVNETCRRDKVSKIFFDEPLPKNYIYAICDNRIGIYALSHIFNTEFYKLKTFLINNLNSYQVSGVETDITSYFFSFFTVHKK